MKYLGPTDIRWLLSGRGVPASEPSPTRSDRGLLVRTLPAWPLVLPFAGYLVGWALGLGDMIWLLFAVVMMLSWVGMSNLRLPPVLSLWALFILWCAVTLVMTDTTGRFIGALFRLVLYASAGILFIHTCNSSRRFTLRVLASTMTWHLMAMTIGGYLGILAPELQIRTPLASIVPGGLLSNEVIHDMVIRRVTQWNADSWVATAPRPSAPFLYTNTWGNVYSIVLPLALLNVSVARRRWRRIATVLIAAASVVPAAATLNRGMLIGLGVVAAWVALIQLRNGRYGVVAAGAVAAGGAGLVWFGSPAARSLEQRLAVSASTSDRFELYRLTVTAALESPLLGYGSPRPSPHAWLPSLGTQGQFWLLMYSHGFIGLGLFIAFFAVVLVKAWRRTDLAGAVAGGAIAATFVEMFFYGMTTGLMVSMLAAALVVRSDLPADGDETRRFSARLSRAAIIDNEGFKKKKRRLRDSGPVADAPE